MSVLRVTKEFSFDMAHALYQYPGACKNIHGHTYHLSVTLRGKVKDIPGGGDDGMVLDFGKLKSLVQEEILYVYDHALVLKREQASLIHEEYAKAMNLKWIVMEKQPTCENLLLHFKKILQGKLKHESHLELIHLRLRETPTAYCEWFLDDEKT